MTLAVPALREPSAVTNNAVVRAVVNVTVLFCPSWYDRHSLFAAYATNLNIFTFANFMALSWWCMMAAAILEITGGSFYATPGRIEKITKRRKADLSQKWKKRSIADELQRTLILLMFVYLASGISEFSELKILSESGAEGNIVPFYKLAQPMLIFGGALLSTAAWIQGAYNFCLYRISNIHWNYRNLSPIDESDDAKPQLRNVANRVLFHSKNSLRAAGELDHPAKRTK